MPTNIIRESEELVEVAIKSVVAFAANGELDTEAGRWELKNLKSLFRSQQLKLIQEIVDIVPEEIDLNDTAGLYDFHQSVGKNACRSAVLKQLNEMRGEV